MRVLVIGGTRFVGYLLVEQLLARGDRVTLLNRGTLPDPFGDRVERLRGDRTRELERLVAGRSFDAAADFAAYERRDVEEAIASLKTGHYVFISTGQVYLVRAGCPRPSREEDYDGPTIAEPASEPDLSEWRYGAGKRACEDALAAAPAFPSTRIRIPVVNGERDPSRRLESYLWRIRDGGPVLLPGGGGHRVRHCYGLDVARALAALLGRDDTKGRAYNLANEDTPALDELVALLAREMGSPSRAKPVSVAHVVEAGLDPRLVSPFNSSWQSFVEPSRARRELGWAPTPLAQQVRSVIAHWTARPPEDPPEGYAQRAVELAL